MKPAWNSGAVTPGSNRIVVGLYAHSEHLDVVWGETTWEVGFFRYEEGEGWSDFNDPDCTCAPPSAWIDLPEVPK